MSSYCNAETNSDVSSKQAENNALANSEDDSPCNGNNTFSTNSSIIIEEEEVVDDDDDDFVKIERMNDSEEENEFSSNGSIGIDSMKDENYAESDTTTVALPRNGNEKEKERQQQSLCCATQDKNTLDTKDDSMLMDSKNNLEVKISSSVSSNNKNGSVSQEMMHSLAKSMLLQVQAQQEDKEDDKVNKVEHEDKKGAMLITSKNIY